jgi:hypothetical protein
MIRRSGLRFAEQIMRHPTGRKTGGHFCWSRVPLSDLKFLHELAAGALGTSNRRH